MTRAQALLIVVGNSEILALDALWRAFMNYVYENGGWTGHRISWNPRSTTDDFVDEVTCRARNEAEEELSRLKALILRADGDGGNLLGSYEGEGDEIDGDLGDGLIIEDP